MRILNWVQSKLYKGQDKKRSVDACSSSARRTPLPDIQEDELSDWTHALLTIGTLGNKLKDGPNTHFQSPHNPRNFSLEEAVKLKKELNSPDGSGNGDEGELSPEIKRVLNIARDILSDKRHVNRPKSVSFLLKNLFVCGYGLPPAPSLRDPITEPRLEKLLRALLHKKIYPQSSAAKTTKKYCLENKRAEETSENGSKWVKTDSEYIVLEI